MRFLNKLTAKRARMALAIGSLIFSLAIVSCESHEESAYERLPKGPTSGSQVAK
jgi:hypothetical protein